MDQNIKVLASRVKQLRMIRGVSQTRMADEIGVSQTNLSNMEAGRTAITTQNLFKIQKVLNCKMADFFVDFDSDEAVEVEQCAISSGIELEDAVKILKLLKAVDIKGV